MKAGLRWGWEYAAAAAMVLAPASALAQAAGQPATQNATKPATDAVGPRELQNFNLQGTVTSPAPTGPTTALPSAPAATSGPPPAPAGRTAANTAERPAPASASPSRDVAARAPDSPAKASPAKTAPVSPSASPPIIPGTVAGEAASAPSLSVVPAQARDGGHVSLLPWLLAAVIVALGAFYFFWRSRSRLEFAGAGGFEAYEPAGAPEPPPVPKPMPRAAVAPMPAPAAIPPAIAGIVSTRLRPWVEVSFEPLTCIVDDEKVVIEFELELFNSGNAPARSVLVEARLVNASQQQDEHLSAFFGNPVGQGQRIANIPPLKRMAFKSAVVTERKHLQIYDVEGRKVFVPLLAFNVLYSWASGEGQSSLSYLVGRDTKGDKMAPFRADLGAKAFQGLGKQLLPVGLRQ